MTSESEGVSRVPSSILTYILNQSNYLLIHLIFFEQIFVEIPLLGAGIISNSGKGFKKTLSN